VTDNDWHTVTAGGDAAIKRWIADQMLGRSCTVVLVGAATANRKWINHEIVRSWDERMGVVGIYIHGLKNLAGDVSIQGANPFDYIGFGHTVRKLSSVVKCYNPSGADSKAKYAWIAEHLSNAVEEAVRIRASN
jgi:MTH538 TIR-like domain (DUF1863)